MSKTDEIRNRFHGSIDAPSSVRQRNGESEDGEALGELLSDNSRSALEELEEREERPERVRFLKQFFALLKQTLTPEEFKFKDGTKTVYLSELECTPVGSDLKCLAAPFMQNTE